MLTLWIALGSALGGVLRHWISSAAAPWLERALGIPGAPFLGTVLVNVSGSFVIGFLAALGPSPLARQLFMVGLLGGYTTFSSFSLQTLELAQGGRWALAGANVLGSVALSLAAVWLGHLCGLPFRR